MHNVRFPLTTLVILHAMLSSRMADFHISNVVNFVPSDMLEINRSQLMTRVLYVGLASRLVLMNTEYNMDLIEYRKITELYFPSNYSPLKRFL